MRVIQKKIVKIVFENNIKIVNETFNAKIKFVFIEI